MNTTLLKKNISNIYLSKSNSDINFFTTKRSFLDKNFSSLNDVFLEINKISAKEYGIQSDELHVYGLLLREYLEDKGLNDLPDDHKFEWSLPSSRGVYEYKVKEIKDLATLFEVAAENKCVMEAWW